MTSGPCSGIRLPNGTHTHHNWQQLQVKTEQSGCNREGIHHATMPADPSTDPRKITEAICRLHREQLMWLSYLPCKTSTQLRDRPMYLVGRRTPKQLSSTPQDTYTITHLTSAPSRPHWFLNSPVTKRSGHSPPEDGMWRHLPVLKSTPNSS